MRSLSASLLSGSAAAALVLTASTVFAHIDLVSPVSRYVVTRPVLDALADRLARTTGELQLTEGYAALTDGARGVYAVEFSADSYDCGTPQEFARATTRYATWSAAGRLAEVH